MPVTVEEKFESRRVNYGDRPSADLKYVIRGTDDDVVARLALQTFAPPAYNINGDGSIMIPLTDVGVEPVGAQLWDGFARYSGDSQSSFAFETGGGTQHITRSLQTVNKYAPPGKTAPDNKQSVGATADGVEGVDIVVPVYSFSETHFLADSLVTPAYKAALYALTGRVNNAGFKGFAAGEVLFLGAAGSKRLLGDWEITYRFSASPNVTDLTIPSLLGNITGIAKKGWEYLWIRYEEVKDDTAKMLIKTPAAVYVEKVYELGDFSGLGIGV